MKHHFGDFLDRTGDYWTIIPNRERYAHSADDDIEDKASVVVLTVSKTDQRWKQVFECPNMEELTLHEISKEQLASLKGLTQIKRLRVTFLRTPEINFITNFPNVEELVLEYVSEFSDLSPLQKLTKLKSLHLENLRRVSDFNGLSEIHSLRYLDITGTLDWNQPIENFNFLESLTNLEVLSLGWVTNKSEFPVFLPIVKLKKLKKILIGRTTFKTKDCAFLEVAQPDVERHAWEPCWNYGERVEFLGKRAGWVQQSSPNAKGKCEEFIKAYEQMKTECQILIREMKF